MRSIVLPGCDGKNHTERGDDKCANATPTTSLTQCDRRLLLGMLVKPCMTRSGMHPSILDSEMEPFK